MSVFKYYVTPFFFLNHKSQESDIFAYGKLKRQDFHFSLLHKTGNISENMRVNWGVGQREHTEFTVKSQTSRTIRQERINFKADYLVLRSISQHHVTSLLCFSSDAKVQSLTNQVLGEQPQHLLGTCQKCKLCKTPGICSLTSLLSDYSHTEV